MLDEDLVKKAAKMLLNGATLLREPCPYCTGVRVIKDGHALCVNCGKEPEKKDISKQQIPQKSFSLEKNLEQKIESLSKELEDESNPQKQQEIIKTINQILETIKKVKQE